MRILIYTVFIFLVSCAAQKQFVVQNDKNGQDFVEFNTKLEQEINSKGADTLLNHIDMEYFNRGVKRILIDKSYNYSFSVDTLQKYLKVLIGKYDSFLQNDSTWKFSKLLKLSEDGRKSEGLIRISSDDGTVYLTLYMQKSGPNIVITDIYTYHNQMTLTQFFAHLISFPKTIQDISKYSVFDNKKNVWKIQYENLNAFKAYNRAAQRRDYSEMVTIYKKFPLKLKQDPIILSAKVELAASKGNKEYLDALTDMYIYGTPNMHRGYYMYDYYFLNKEYTKARDYVLYLENLFGEEAGLFALIARTYEYEGDYSKAIEQCEKAIKLDPDLKEPYHILYGVFLSQKRYRDVILILDIMEARFNHNYDRPLFEDNPDLSEFVHSQEYKDWSKRLEPRD